MRAGWYGEARHRERKMDGARQDNTVRGEQRRRQYACDDHYERTGYPRDVLEREQPAERNETASETRHVPVAVVARKLHDERKEPVAVRLHVDQVRPLLDRDHQREPEGVAAQHWAGDRARHRTESQRRAEREREPRSHHEDRGERHAPGAAATPERQGRRGEYHR